MRWLSSYKSLIYSSLLWIPSHPIFSRTWLPIYCLTKRCKSLSLSPCWVIPTANKHALLSPLQKKRKENQETNFNYSLGPPDFFYSFAQLKLSFLCTYFLIPHRLLPPRPPAIWLLLENAVKVTTYHHVLSTPVDTFRPLSCFGLVSCLSLSNRPLWSCPSVFPYLVSLSLDTRNSLHASLMPGFGAFPMLPSFSALPIFMIILWLGPSTNLCHCTCFIPLFFL